jgi:hypothetical protein
MPLTFLLVGEGLCLDSNGQAYDLVYLTGQANNIAAAYNWCLTASAYTSKLVGVEIDTDGNWFCDYDKGIVDPHQSQQLAVFSPPASGILTNGDSGTGAISSTTATNGVFCFKNLVRLIDVLITA